MKNTIKIASILGLLTTLIVPGQAFAQSTFQRVDAIIPFTTTTLKGAGTLVRKAGPARGKGQNGQGPDGHGSIHLRVAMSELDPNASYSTWFIIFNLPCAAGPGMCTEPEISKVVNAGGFVTGDDGTGYFVGELEEGPVPTGIANGDPFGSGDEGLTDSFASEVHVILQSHGPIVAGSVAGQISIPGFACGPCADQAAILFPPMQP